MASITDWPDVVHVNILQHLGSACQIWGFLWPYATLSRSLRLITQSAHLWRHVGEFGCDCKLSGETLQALLGRRAIAEALQHLSLRGLEIVDDDLVLAILRQLPCENQLRSLDLGRCGEVSVVVVPEIYRCLPQLQALAIEYMLDLEDKQLRTLCDTCPYLDSINARGCEHLSDVSWLMKQSGRWKSLQFDGCFRLDVGRLLEGPYVFASLEDLSLDGEEMAAHHLAALATLCPRLQSLAVSFAAELNCDALAALAALKRLDALTLKKAASPSDDAWANFFLQQRQERAEDIGPGWRLLSFCEGELFCDTAARALATEAQPRLLELDLSWCWNLGDAGLGALLAMAPGLHRLNVAGMKSLSAGGLLPCCRMPSLEELDCTSCNSVQDSFLEFLFRLFLAPPGLSDDALPGLDELPLHVRGVAEALWSRRQRWASRLKIKNYYAQFLEDWSPFRPALTVCTFAESLFEEWRL